MRLRRFIRESKKFRNASVKSFSNFSVKKFLRGEVIKNKFMNKFISTTAAVWLASAVVLVPVASFADTLSDLQAQIAALTAQLAALQASSPSSSAACTFSRSLTIGSRGDDVTCLQNYLTSTGHFTYSGGATGYFGGITKAAVAAWQSANGVSPTAGYWGPLSQAKYSSVAVAPAPAPAPAPTPISGQPTVSTGQALSVTAAASQPAASIVPPGVSRSPFTNVVFTAGFDGDIVVNSVTVQREGVGADASLSGIVLLDENGMQIGLSKTLNSNHQAILTSPFTVKAGTSRAMQIGANRGAAGAHGGEVLRLTVVAVDAGGASVTGLPVTGTGQTINETLTVGSFTLTRGPNDPGSSQTKEVGTVGYTFASIKGTAGSGEDVWVKTVRFNQSGSAAASDVANIKVYVNGTAYDTIVSSDGKYYTATFGANGLQVLKGNSIEMTVKGDVVSGSNRTIMFDLYRYEDVNVLGGTYGFGILPSATDSGGSATDHNGTFQASNPNYDSYTTTVGTGSLTVSKGVAPAAQNIAVQLSDQPLGGWDVEVKGEPVQVGQMVFRLFIGSDTAAADVDDITNIALYDSTGKVVAGPKDGACEDQAGTACDAAPDGNGTVTFTDTVTFPVGKSTYILKGKLGTDFTTDQTISASTTPTADWTNRTGQQTGTSITPSAGTFQGNTMTVKTATNTVSVGSDPVAQNVVAGINQFVVAKFIFDGTASGEDVRYTSMSFQFNGTAFPTGCTLWDGTTALNSGTNRVSPTTVGDKTFTLDSNLVVAKGVTKTVSMACDIPAGISGNMHWDLPTTGSLIAGTGLVSGQTVNASYTVSALGPTMTLATAGTLTVTLDASSPTYTVVAANSTDVTLGLLRFHAANEAISLQKLALQLTSPAASSSPADLVKYTLWDGSTKVGEGVFAGSNRNATTTLSASFIIPKDGDKVMTVKGDLNAIGTSLPGTQGNLLRVDYDGHDSLGTQGSGQSSGSNIVQGSADTAVNGVRIFKSFPVVAKVAVPTNTLNNGTMSILRFKVTADSHGDLGLYKFTFRMATTTAAITSVIVYGYSDSAYSTAAYANSGRLNSTAILATGNATWVSSATDLDITFDPIGQAATPEAIQVPAGTTRYFDVTGTVTGAVTGASVSTQLQGDAGYPSLPKNNSGMSTSTNMMTNAGTVFGVDSDTNDNFIWSPNATTTAGVGHLDWTNGFGVLGLPSTNLSAEVLSK